VGSGALDEGRPAMLKAVDFPLASASMNTQGSIGPMRREAR
jgi:hypothetical protein